LRCVGRRIFDIPRLIDPPYTESMAHYICPVCRSPRKLNLQDKMPAMTHVRITVSLGMLIGALMIGGAGPWVFKLALLYFPIWGAMELIHWAEQKSQTVCRACNFDPFLYQKDWRAARASVETRLNTIKAERYAKPQPASQTPTPSKAAIDSAQ
jgi:hypothetical protein